MLRRRILSTEAIEDSFSNIEIYKTIIMDGSIDIRFDIPKPNTSIPDFKYMYICQKIFQKIEKENNFHFQNQIDGKDVSLKEVDLSEERQYIQNELPVMKDLDHEFRISSKILPKYIKVEVWKSNLFFDKNYVVDPKDLFHNSKKFADEILIKLIKGVEGSKCVSMQSFRR